eukprot:11709533-Karenia_brevis.AAC.1
MLRRVFEAHVTMWIRPRFQSVSSKAQNSVISVTIRMFLMLKLPTLSCRIQCRMPSFALYGRLSLICGSILPYPVMISSQQNFVP